MPGDIKYKDINNDGIIDINDEVPIGYPTTPEIIYGLESPVAIKIWICHSFSRFCKVIIFY